MIKPFNALCIVERMPGLVNNYIGVICYLPETQFKKGDKVRVTVERVAASESAPGEEK